MCEAGVVTSSCPSACPCLLPCLSAKAGPCHALCPFSPRRGWGSTFSVLCLRSVGSGPESWTTLSLLQVLPSDPRSEEPPLEWESVTEDATASSQVALDCWGGRSSSFPPRPGVDAGLGVAVEESSHPGRTFNNWPCLDSCLDVHLSVGTDATSVPSRWPPPSLLGREMRPPVWELSPAVPLLDQPSPPLPVLRFA